MKVLENIEPYKVFEFFEYISSVPRGSGNTSKVADLCVEFAKKRGLTCIKDALNNVIIYKPGSKGYEDSPTVIIQGHLDMVCAKNENCNIDMNSDPIELCHDEKFVFAKNTTLGGDDGIAIAYAMAVLDSDELEHPPIEAVFTVDEETGMNGADGINAKHLQGKILLNIDSEEEGVFTCGCAGGCRINGVIPVNRTEIGESGLNEKCVMAEIVLSGLKGGHSGMEIDKQPASSNSLLGRVLYELYERVGFRIVTISGGEFDNVITDRSQAQIVFNESDKEAFAEFLKEYDSELKDEYSCVNPNINLGFKIVKDDNLKTDHSVKTLDEDSTKKILNALYLSFQGVLEMSHELKGMVQTSQNLGIISLNEDRFTYSFLVRSSIDKQKDTYVKKICALTEILGGSSEILCDYPGWKFKNDSILREKCVKVYRELFNKEPIVNTIHAGLECGFFADKIKGLDVVSFGPDILNIHTPEEKLDIESVKRTWEFLKRMLKELK